MHANGEMNSTEMNYGGKQVGKHRAKYTTSVMAVCLS